MRSGGKEPVALIVTLAVLGLLAVTVFGAVVGYRLFRGGRESQRAAKRWPNFIACARAVHDSIGREACDRLDTKDRAAALTYGDCLARAAREHEDPERTCNLPLAFRKEPPPAASEPRATGEAPEPLAPAASNEPLPEVLSAGDITQVIKKVSLRAKKDCWQPALDSRRPSDPTSTRISFEIQIDKAGKVEKILSNAVPSGYPGLSACITELLRGTTFPKASTTTTVNVPFVFAAK